MNYTTTTEAKHWFIFREKDTGKRFAVELNDIICFKDGASDGGEILARGLPWIAVVETFDRFVELLTGAGGK